MTSPSNPLFAEHSLTLVAALFGDGRQAQQVAERLRAGQQAEVDVVQPGDTQWMRKMEPEGQAIKRGAWRSHRTLMPLGFVLGLVLSLLLVRSWPAAAASPLLTGIAVTLFATFAAGMLAGLLTLRPDRSAVALQLRAGLNQGRWAVVAHPRNEAGADAVGDALRQAGGEVLRSL